jgi:hypothetical protein
VTGNFSLRRTYPRKIEIERAVAAAKACGVDVASVEVAPDGTIKVSEARGAVSQSLSEFDRWDAAGRL